MTHLHSAIYVSVVKGNGREMKGIEADVSEEITASSEDRPLSPNHFSLCTQVLLHKL